MHQLLDQQSAKDGVAPQLLSEALGACTEKRMPVSPHFEISEKPLIREKSYEHSRLNEVPKRTSTPSNLNYFAFIEKREEPLRNSLQEKPLPRMQFDEAKIVTAKNLHQDQFSKVMSIFATCGNINGFKFGINWATASFTTKEAAEKAMEYDNTLVCGNCVKMELGDTYKSLTLNIEPLEECASIDEDEDEEFGCDNISYSCLKSSFQKKRELRIKLLERCFDSILKLVF